MCKNTMVCCSVDAVVSVGIRFDGTQPELNLADL